MNQIDILWEQEKNSINTRGKSVCNKETVLRYLLESKKTWVWSWEFQDKRLFDGTRLSHRACARASDLAIQHPELVECRKHKRFAAYRVRRENIKQIQRFLNEQTTDSTSRASAESI